MKPKDMSKISEKEVIDYNSQGKHRDCYQCNACMKPQIELKREVKLLRVGLRRIRKIAVTRNIMDMGEGYNQTYVDIVNKLINKRENYERKTRTSNN